MLGCLQSPDFFSFCQFMLLNNKPYLGKPDIALACVLFFYLTIHELGLYNFAEGYTLYDYQFMCFCNVFVNNILLNRRLTLFQ